MRVNQLLKCWITICEFELSWIFFLGPFDYHEMVFCLAL